MSGECNLLSSVLSQQKFEVTDVKAVGRSMLSDSPCYSSWTNELYLENKGKYILKPRGPADSKDTKRRERENKCARVGERDPRPFGSSFYVFFPPPGLPYVNWASHECCLFYLMSSLWSLDLPLFYFHRLFPSLSFSHHHSGLLFCILTT